MISTNNITLSQSDVNVKSITKKYLVHQFFINKPKNGFHKLTDWDALDLDLGKVTLALKSGKAIIPAIVDIEEFTNLQKNYKKRQVTTGEKISEKDWSVTTDLIIESDIIALDFDVISINEISDRRFIEYSFFGYATPTSVNDPVRGWTKHRWLIKLPKPVAAKYLTTFRSIFIERFAPTSDMSVANAHQMIYGCNKHIFKEELSCVLDDAIFNEIYAEAYDRVSNQNVETIKDKSDDSLTAKVDNHFYQYIEKNGFAAFIENVFPDFAWELKSVANDTDTIDKLVGCNPFSESNNSGTSLCWMLKDNGRIIFLDRANNIAGNFYEFWVLYQHYISHEVLLDKSIDDDKTIIEFELKKGNFQKVINKICNNLNLDTFNFAENSKVTLDLELLKEIVIVCDSGDSTYSYYYYSPSTKTWHYTKNKKSVMSAIKSYCEELEITWISTTKSERKNKKGEKTKESSELNLISYNLSRLEDEDKLTYKPGDEIQESFDFVGFKNKAFNLKTNEFVDHHPSMKFKNISNIEIPDFIDPKWADPFIEFNKKWCKSDREAKLLLFNSIIGYRRCAHYYLLITHLVGGSQIGKTVYAESIGRAFIDRDELLRDDRAYLADILCKDPKTGNSRSPDWNIIRKDTRVALLDEMEDYTLAIEEIKRVANRFSQVTIDEKYTKKYNVLCRFPVIGASEVIPKMPNTLSEGGYNRLQWVDLRHWNKELMNSTMYDENLTMLDQLKATYLNREACIQFMLWSLVHVSSDDLDQMYAEICSEASSISDEILEENTGINAFEILLSEHYEFTLVEDDYSFTADVIHTFDEIENEQDCRGWNNKRKSTTGKTFNKRFEEYLQKYQHEKFIAYRNLKQICSNSNGKTKQKEHPEKKTNCPVIWGLKPIKPIDKF